jgi:hypothetical protein
MHVTVPVTGSGLGQLPPAPEIVPESIPTELKHCCGQSADTNVVLIESPARPRYEIHVCRPDGVFLLIGTDDEEIAEATYLWASLVL